MNQIVTESRQRTLVSMDTLVAIDVPSGASAPDADS